VARVVASFPSEKAAAVLPIVDRWTAIMRRYREATSAICRGL